MTILEITEAINIIYPIWYNVFFYLFVFTITSSFFIIIFIMKALKIKNYKSKLMEQQHVAKIDNIRKENEKKLDRIRVEMIKQEAENSRQWMESEKETLHVLNGVSALLELGEKFSRMETNKLLKLLYAVEKKIDGGNNNIKDFIDSEEKYKKLFNNSVTAFALHEIILDKKGKPIDYRFLEINPAFEKLTGLKKDELIGKTCLNVLPKTEQRWIDVYGKVALTGESKILEETAALLNKQYRVVVYSPEPKKFATIFIDITKQYN